MMRSLDSLRPSGLFSLSGYEIPLGIIKELVSKIPWAMRSRSYNNQKYSTFMRAIVSTRMHFMFTVGYACTKGSTSVVMCEVSITVVQHALERCIAYYSDQSLQLFILKTTAFGLIVKLDNDLKQRRVATQRAALYV